MMRIAATALIIAAAAGSVAQAQSYGSPYVPQPYPYVAAQPYAIEVAPNTYVIQRPQPRGYPYVTCVNCSRTDASSAVRAPSAPRFDRPIKPNDPTLIEQLRKRYSDKEGNTKETVINTKKIVRAKPIVRETTRVVQDPPRVIERRHVVEDLPLPKGSRRRAEASVDEPDLSAKSDPDQTRVIRAEAEVTILGPDRMSIRLFRKRGEPEAKARPGE